MDVMYDLLQITLHIAHFVNSHFIDKLANAVDPLDYTVQVVQKFLGFILYIVIMAWRGGLTALRDWTSLTSCTCCSLAFTNDGKTSTTSSCFIPSKACVFKKAFTSISRSYFFVWGFVLNFMRASVPSITNILVKSASCTAIYR